MPKDPVGSSVSIAMRLREIRSAVATGHRERHDPRRIYADVEGQFAACAGEIALVRDFAPGVGEVWDTLVELWSYTMDLYELVRDDREGDIDERVCSPIHADNAEPAVPAGDAGGGGGIILPD